MRRALTFALAFGFCSACGGRSGAKNGPVSVVVAPAGSTSTLAVSAPTAWAEQRPPPLEIVAAFGRLCARADERVYCAPVSKDAPVVHERNMVPGIEGATSLAMGRSFGCAATRSGTVYCFGDNSFGQLGGKLRVEKNEAPTQVIGVARARRVFAGPFHACASLDDGTLYCWGRNESGQTGSDTNYLPDARELAGASAVIGVTSGQVACGFSATCALSARREVTCWGAVQDDHNAVVGRRPDVVADLSGIEEVAAGESAFCAIRKGSVVCWGAGRSLVAPAATSQGASVVEGITNARHLSIADDHGCAVLADGRVACFGFPHSHALGRAADESAYQAVPGEVVADLLPPARAVTVSPGLSCALTKDDEVYCWGRWYSDKGTHDEIKPVRIPLR